MKPSAERLIALLTHIQDHIVETLFFVEGMSFNEFIGDSKVNKAIYKGVLHNFCIIGEVSRLIKKDFSNFLESHLEMPWVAMAQTRNRVLHGYDTVKPKIIWEAVKNDFPQVLALLPGLIDSVSAPASYLDDDNHNEDDGPRP
ncbi:hypothetical protein FACS189460_4110 [Deltaproteobacteria bacterium]|nr:hypothetical protein FACS189460_4110 [Deltaproteobacteria bacterium]